MDAKEIRDRAAVFVVGSAAEAGELEQGGHVAANMAAGEFDELVMLLTRMREPPIVILRLEEKAAEDAAKVLDRRVLAWVRPLDGATADEAYSDAEKRAATLRDEAERRVMASLKVKRGGDCLTGFAAGGTGKESIPTGIAPFDNLMGGGLRTGELVTLGALSSVGKTTLCLQIGDHMAAAGRAVLFVTIEQGRDELVAKSVSRLTAETGGPVLGAWEILRGDHAGRESPENRALNSACVEYIRRGIDKNMWILESDDQPGVQDVWKAARALTKDKPPVVILDYLQLLATPNDRLTDKQATDINVKSLRQLARELNTIVLAISSLNRSSYSDGVTLESFKESGSIEYSSDVLLGLQPADLKSKVGNSETTKRSKARDAYEEMKRERIRDMELVVLKNRSGAMPKPIQLTYDALANLWTPAAMPARPKYVV